MTTANDFHERDPASWVVSGSSDESGPFSEIARGDFTKDSTRKSTQTVYFQNTKAYSVYRVIFPTIVSSSTATSMQVAEVGLLGSTCATDTSMTHSFIGSTTGNVFHNSQSITKHIQAQGADIWGTNDSFFFYQMTIPSHSYLSKRFEIEMYTKDGFDDGTWSHTWAKFGLMVREKLTPSSRHFSMLVTPSNGAYSFQRSYENSETSSSKHGVDHRGGAWLKIERLDNRFRASIRGNPISTDDETFYHTVAETTIENMFGDIHVGIALSSRTSTLSEVKFQSFTLKVNHYRCQ